MHTVSCRCSAACFLSPAAAETICQAASTAAAAAAAAVRSAVLSIDAGEAGEAPCYAGECCLQGYKDVCSIFAHMSI